MKKTAFERAIDSTLPLYAIQALGPQLHPQTRTMAFHQFYDAPIYFDKADRGFSHMTDERVAFRAAFILSEVMELLEKGLGIRTSFNVYMKGGTYTATNSAEAKLGDFIAEALKKEGKRDLVEVVDALGDLNVVVNGFAIELGVDMDKIDREICASNFTKAGEDGQPIIGDGTTGPVGKVLKGPNYLPPQIALMLGFENDHCPGHTASDNNPKVCRHCGTHIDEYRDEPEKK